MQRRVRVPIPVGGGSQEISVDCDADAWSVSTANRVTMFMRVPTACGNSDFRCINEHNLTTAIGTAHNHQASYQSRICNVEVSFRYLTSCSAHPLYIASVVCTYLKSQTSQMRNEEMSNQQEQLSIRIKILYR